MSLGIPVKRRHTVNFNVLGDGEQLLGQAHGWFHRIFQDSCMAFAPTAVIVGSVGPGLAQGSCSSCCFETLGSCGIALVDPGRWC